MLIKVTNHCGMGCSHCMENSTVRGKHMDLATFDKALDCADRVEVFARELGYRFVLLSGGECTDHPQIITLIEKVFERNLIPLLITNGMWLNNPELTASILRPEWGRLSIQVTNDPRFYPKSPPQNPDPRICYVDSLTLMVPLGRFAKKGSHPEIPNRMAPSSFNIRSLTRQFGDVRLAVAYLRQNALTGKSGHCAPSISSDGTFVAGETSQCFQVGTVDSSPADITKGIMGMQCNRCGLVTGLSSLHRAAIGEG